MTTHSKSRTEGDDYTTNTLASDLTSSYKSRKYERVLTLLHMRRKWYGKNSQRYFEIRVVSISNALLILFSAGLLGRLISVSQYFGNWCIHLASYSVVLDIEDGFQ